MMRTLIRLTFALIAFSSPLSAAITGTVISADGTALRAARVRAFARESADEMRRRILSASPDRVALATAETNEAGAFALEPGAPVVDLVFDAPGRAVAGRDAADGESVETVLLRDLPPLTGTVTAAGKPVAGAVIAAPSGLVARTDDKGRYTIALQSRGVPLSVVHPSYAATSIYPRAAGAADARLVRGATVRGRVVNTADEPVANATIRVDGWPLARSGGDGSFTVEHAPAQWKTLEAEEGARLGSAKAARGAAHVIRLVPAATISGVARDEKGRPVAGAIVSAAGRGAVTDAKGRFTIGPLPAGTQSMFAVRFGHEFRRSDVRLTEGARAQRDVTLSSLPLLLGTVVDVEKKPVAGVRIESLGSDFPAVTGPDGRFRARVPYAEMRDVVTFAARKSGYAPALVGPVPSPPLKEVTVVLERGFELQLNVIDGARSAVADEPVQIARSLSGDERYPPLTICGEGCTTDRAGTLRTRVTEGKYDITVGGGGAVFRRLAGEPVDPRRASIVVTVQRAATVTGIVLEEDGSPAKPPMQVRVQTGDGEASVTAYAAALMQEDGTFVLTGVPTGPVTLFAQQFGDGNPLPGPPLEVKAPATGVELRAPRTIRITGRVIDRATSQPVRDFSVQVRRFRGGGFGVGNAQAFHSDDGQFTLERVPAASVDLIVTAPGYARAVANVVGGEESTRPLEVRLEPGATLRVRVTSAGRAVPAARINVLGERDGVGRGRPTQTDEEGISIIESLSAGDYTIVVMKKGFVAAQKNVQITSPKEEPVDVELEAGQEVSGSVVDESGRPVANARVQVAPGGRGRFASASAQSDAEGAFVLDGLEAEPTTLTATKNGFITARAENVQPGSGARVTLTLTRGGTLSGRVLGVSPEEMASVMVYAYSNRGRSETRPEAAGNFTLTGLPDDRVVVSATLRSATPRTTEGKSVQMTNGSAPPVDLEFTAGATVRGRVTRGGTPLPDAAVQFRKKEGRVSPTRSLTNLDGTYVATLAEPGEYEVSVVTRGTPWIAGTTMVSSSTTYDIDVRGAVLRGRIVDASTGAPVAGAILFLMRDGARGPASYPANSDSDGTFVFDTVTPGAYELRVSKPRYLAVTRRVEVSESGSPELDIALARGEALVLRVVDDTTGDTVDRVSISVRDMANKPVATGGTARDESGAVSVAVPAGRYKIGVHAPDYPWQNIEATVPGPEIFVRLTRAGRVVIEGRLEGALRTRLSSTSTSVTLTQPAPPARFEAVAPGTWNVEILGDKNAVLRTRTITVTAGVTTTVALD